MSDQLEHYGVKGMEWGKKKKSQTNGGSFAYKVAGYSCLYRSAY